MSGCFHSTSSQAAAIPHTPQMRVNKWLKKDFGGLIAHSLRHTFRDRLRAVECPMDVIDQIGGWRSAGGVGGEVWGGLFR